MSQRKPYPPQGTTPTRTPAAKTDAGGAVASQLRGYALEASLASEQVRQAYRKILAQAEAVHQRNERAFQNVKKVRHALMAARNLQELLATMFQELTSLDVHHVSLTLATETISPLNPAVEALPHGVTKRLDWATRADIQKRLIHDGKTAIRIGPKRQVDQTGTLFGLGIRSSALLPLEHQNELLGSLNLGSRTLDRFDVDQNLDLLEDLGVTAALCLDNVLVHQRTEQLAATDSLTGVYNRRYFYELAGRALDLSRRHGDPVSIVYVDLNEFKPINDHYGHDVGDLVLKRLADTIRSRIRKTDLLARLGGDEFALLLPRVDSKKAAGLAETLKRQVGLVSFEDLGYADLKMSAAFGSAEAVSGDTVDELLSRADQAMYKDKGNKKR